MNKQLALDAKITHMIKQDLKRVSKRGKDLQKLSPVVISLSKGKSLAAKYKDHALKGTWRGYRECHLETDWLLIYKVNKPFFIFGPNRNTCRAYGESIPSDTGR